MPPAGHVKPRLLEFCEPHAPLQNSERVLRPSKNVVSHTDSPRNGSAVKWNVLLFAGQTRNDAAASSSQRGLTSFENRLRDIGRSAGRPLPAAGLAVWPSASTQLSDHQGRPTSAHTRPQASSAAVLCSSCSVASGPSIAAPHDLRCGHDDVDERLPGASEGLVGVGQQRPSRPYSAPSRRDVEDVKRLLNLVQMRTGEGVANFGCTVPASTSPYRHRTTRPASARVSRPAAAAAAQSETTPSRNPVPCSIVAAFGDDIRTGIAPAPPVLRKKTCPPKSGNKPPSPRNAASPPPPPASSTTLSTQHAPNDSSSVSATNKHFTYRRNFDGFTSLESWQLPVPRTFHFASNTVPAIDKFSPTRWRPPQ